MKIIASTGFVFVIGLMIGCSKSTPEDKSRVKWGALAEGGTKWLVDVKPDETIGVCGKDASAVESLIKSIKIWAEPIGRADKLKIIKSCDGVAKFVRITSGSNGPCGGASAGCSGGNDIWVVDPNGAVGFNVILHEVGHQWGMCDQYDVTAYTGLPGNCATEGPRGKDPRSVMGTARGLTKLTQDDIEGIKYLADLYAGKSRKTSANEAWKKYASDNVSPSRDDKPSDAGDDLTFNEPSSDPNTGMNNINDQTYGIRNDGLICPAGYLLKSDGYCHLQASAASGSVCPAGYYLATDGYCHLSAVQNVYSCPAGYVLYTDGYCRAG